MLTAKHCERCGLDGTGPDHSLVCSAVRKVEKSAALGAPYDLSPEKMTNSQIAFNIIKEWRKEEGDRRGGLWVDLIRLIRDALDAKDGIRPTHNAQGRVLHYVDCDGEPIVVPGEVGMTTDEACRKGIRL